MNRRITTLALAIAAALPMAAAQADNMDGLENVRLLHGGYNEWKERGGMDANAVPARIAEVLTP